MGQLTWQFDLGEFRARARAEAGTYLVQGCLDDVWIAEFIPDPSSSRGDQAPFPAAKHSSLRKAMRACQVHAENLSSDGSGTRRANAFIN